MQKVIITIDRQYGSGGREIGTRVSELLGIPKYDEEFVTLAAKDDSTVTEESLEQVDERATNSFLYTLVMGGAHHALGTAGHAAGSMPLNDRLFAKQSALMHELAEEGSCVMIGRCSDYVLKDEPARLSVYIYGETKDRLARVAARHNISESDASDRINKTDRRRASYYNFYTGAKWGRCENYHLTLNSSLLGIEGTARVIAEMARIKMETK